MDSLAANVSLSGASATGNPRNKTVLKEGRSLMDWIKLTNSGKDLSGCGGCLRDISPEELACHNHKGDAWMAIRGRVYNVTSYFEFHPGGEDELSKGLGIDATELFDQVHRWVNFESMLKKTLVGRLKTNNLSLKRQAARISPAILPPPDPQQVMTVIGSPTGITTDWLQNLSSVTVVIYTRQKDLDPRKISVACDGFNLVVRLIQSVRLNPFDYRIRLEHRVEPHPSIKVSAMTGKVELIFRKVEHSVQWKKIGSSVGASEETDWTLYRTAKLSRKMDVTHNVRLFSFVFGPGNIFHVPVGWHVRIKLVLEDGSSVIRSYTPVAANLLDVQNIVCPAPDVDPNSCILHFLIKIYEEGSLTSRLDRLPEGSLVEISDPFGSFDSTEQLKDKNLLVMSAGTGMTPMVRLVMSTLATSHDRKVYILFFYRQLKDIIWLQLFNQLMDQYQDRLKINHILSEPDTEWDGQCGRISRHLLDETLMQWPTSQSSSLVCVCGPTEFTTESLRLLQDKGWGSRSIHAFLG